MYSLYFILFNINLIIGKLPSHVDEPHCVLSVYCRESTYII